MAELERTVNVTKVEVTTQFPQYMIVEGDTGFPLLEQVRYHPSETMVLHFKLMFKIPPKPSPIMTAGEQNPAYEMPDEIKEAWEVLHAAVSREARKRLEA